jgi:AICAR transformylase/IMP cyclohydrolase PurH
MPRVLMSVYDKSNLIAFATELVGMGGTLLQVVELKKH